MTGLSENKEPRRADPTTAGGSGAAARPVLEVAVHDWSCAQPDVKDKIMRRAQTDIAERSALVAEIIEGVRERKDMALIEYTKRFDHADVAGGLRVDEATIAQAPARLTPTQMDALVTALRHIRIFHEAQKPKAMWMMEVSPGVHAGERFTPIDSIALYVPRGKGSFPSVLAMLGTPAVVAGVPRVVVLTPPAADGQADAGVLAVAHLLGLREVYTVGGAQAIAAVAYGTETVPRCRKVIGPGNSFVNAAKRALADQIDTGVPAGPSEAVIIADEHADARDVALDWLTEAEHGEDSAALLVTPSAQLVEAVLAIVAHLVEEVRDAQRQSYMATVLSRYGGIILVPTLDDAYAFANEYAPEHLQLHVQDPFSGLTHVRNAGEVLLGSHTPIALANFAIGPNAILPTGRGAFTRSPVCVEDFGKRTSVAWASPSGFAALAPTAAALAALEGFPAHAQAITARTSSISSAGGDGQ